MPPKKQRGATARAVFYMSIMYNLPINDREEGVLRNWNVKYPPSAKELERNTKIHNVQGNRNPFVTNPEWVSLISDF
jgi:endonuclease I